MCLACAMRSFRALTPIDRDTVSHAGAVGTFAAIGKLTDALPVDGVGDLKPPVLVPALLTSDTVPDAPDTAGGSNPVLTVTAPGTTTPVVSTIDTIGDQDFYQVTLTAGVAYEFGLYSYNGGPNLVGLTDPYLELYAADGTTLLVSADGGADTVYNQINSGFDVLLVYTPTTSGTFYVNARAFSNSPLTSDGDSVGDYQLFAREQDPNDPTVYRPYYEPTEPLYAIDWGTQVNKINQSARNPDGDEGTRATGNAQDDPVYTDLLDIPALAAAQGMDIAGKNVITIYFAKPGDVFVSNDPTNPGLPPATITAVAIQEFERTAVWTSLAEFSKVADVVYLEVQDRNHADFIYTSYTGTPGPGVSLLGSMSPPDESDEGLAQFNSGDYRWNATDLQQGGFSFVTLIHEFGHGHGLAHPHDNGGRSGIMNGVEQETPTSVANYTTGDYELNQGVFTMMSYEDGWQSSPYGNAPTDVGYGYLGGLMAFDIAAIQDKYGVNEEWATGNNVYALKDANAAGTYFSSIWDGGGTDAIVYAGERDATIDLRAATLLYEQGGGGRVSYADGVFGGFTIANGVTIENARSGGGDDTLIGNAGANVLIGGAGGDTLDGGDGIDTVSYAGSSAGVFVRLQGFGARAGTQYAFGGDAAGDTLVGLTFENATGGNGNDDLIGSTGANVLDGGAGSDALNGYLGNDTLIGGAGADTLNGADGIDTVSYAGSAAGVFVRLQGFGARAGTQYAFGGDAAGDVLVGQTFENATGGNGNDDLIGSSGANVLAGGAGNDALNGYLGNDTLNGGTGADTLTGGDGNDMLYVDNAADVVIEGTGGGSDRVFASVSYALGAGVHVEILSTTNSAGVGAINLTGNGLANSIIGNNGNNVLNGGGGADTLSGLGGNDTFRFTTALGADNIDTIADYSVADDTVQLDDAVFTGLPLGALAAGAFRTGAAAADADDRIIYNSATGALLFDADGNGAGAAVQFATLSAGLAIAAGEFITV